MIEKGQRINDRYEIIKNIGEGGMANVYLAYDTILDRKVAIKVLRGDLSNDEKFVRRFQREALSASSLSHPSVVEIYDVGEDDGTFYIVMEYVEGKTLKQLIKKRGSLTLSESIDIMLQVTDGISHAHDSYIIHRDLKPQNIMIKDDGMIKIMDFGIAMALNSTQLTQTNSVMGSVHYLPPEQASGKGCTIRSDIYSMGIVFYELLTGALPFKGENAVEIALKQMRDPIPSIRKKNNAIPQSVENVILKATAKNPKNRYSDAKEMHADLLTVLNEDRMSESRLIFKYPEIESEEVKPVKKVVKEEVKIKVKEKEEPPEEVIATPVENDEYNDEEDNSKSSKAIIILVSIVAILLIGGLSLFMIMGKKVPDVKVPDVYNLTVVEAENELKKQGFEVELETIKEKSNTVEIGKVIKTSPGKGRSIKKGSKITIYESIGGGTYKIEDYTGKNYIEIKTLLENVYKLQVQIEKKDVDMEEKDWDEQEIIDQSLKPDSEAKENDKIILYIPNIVESYPDMVLEEWTVEDVQAFCDKYELKLTIDYIPTTEYEEGKIISQSRTAKTPIIKGATFKIEVAEKEDYDQKPSPSPSESPSPTTTQSPSSSSSDKENKQ